MLPHAGLAQSQQSTPLIGEGGEPCALHPAPTRFARIMEVRMNKARKTARKRQRLLQKGATEGKDTLLGRWALKIWNQGIGFHKRRAIARAATQAEFNASAAHVMAKHQVSLQRLADGD